MTIGPGISLFKDLEMCKIGAKRSPVVIEDLINKWMGKFLQKGNETAEELVQLVREYEE